MSPPGGEERAVPGEQRRDAELLASMAGGDRGACTELFDRNGAAVFGLLLRILQRRSEAEEMLQEVFLQAWRSAGDYRPALSAPRSWLLMLARSRALDRLRSSRARSEREEEVAHQARLDGYPVEQPLGLARLETEERRRRIADALGRLPEEQRQAVELAFFGGLTHRGIAEHLAAPLGTIKSRILLGLRRLRQTLEEADGVR
jgi:RNA polymerase sigma-70 factor, ECF subfamily